jgi:hypothetical protein
MNAFREAQKIEAKGLEELLPFLKQKAFEGRFVLTAKGELSKELQKTVGDVLLNKESDPERVWGIEIKTEAENKHGNLFIETWSNRKRFTPGWIYMLNTDILLYYFQKEKYLLSIPFMNLKRWAFIESTGWELPGRLWEFPEKPQAKYKQLNDTWGRCVPIEIIRAEIKIKEYLLGENGEYKEMEQQSLFKA